MRIHYHKNFLSSYRKRISPLHKLNKKFKERLEIFLKNPATSLLRDHALVGRKQGYRSFAVTGDIRVVYRRVQDSILLYDIGTHNQVYDE